MNKVGFIQGRLSEVIGEKIQVFPWESWREEFPLAREIGVSLMEWTLTIIGCGKTLL